MNNSDIIKYLNAYNQNYGIKKILYLHSLLNEKLVVSDAESETGIPLVELKQMQVQITFLLLISYIEEWFKRYIDNTYKKRIEGSNFDRFKDPLKSIGVVFNEPNDLEWIILTDAWVVRSCLSHANGFTEILNKKNKNRVKTIIGKYKEVNIVKQRLCINEEYIQKVFMAYKSFIDQVPESYKEKPLPQPDRQKK